MSITRAITRGLTRALTRGLLDGPGGGGAAAGEVFEIDQVIGGSIVGFYASTNYSITPSTYAGETIHHAYSNEGGGAGYHVEFVGQVQVNGWTTMLVAIEGAAEDTYELTWNGTQYFRTISGNVDIPILHVYLASLGDHGVYDFTIVSGS